MQLRTKAQMAKYQQNRRLLQKQSAPEAQGCVKTCNTLCNTPQNVTPFVTPDDYVTPAIAAGAEDIQRQVKAQIDIPITMDDDTMLKYLKANRPHHVSDVQAGNVHALNALNAQVRAWLASKSIDYLNAHGVGIPSWRSGQAGGQGDLP